MALARCPDCGREISTEALACPGCGKPNRSALHKAQDGRQRIGCAIVVLGLILAASFPTAGLVLLIAGLVVIALNTRFS